MPAPSVFELYDFESQIEAAVVTYLTAQFALVNPTLTPQILASFSSDTKETPRLEVQFQPGPSGTQWTTIGQANPKQVPADYMGQLTIKVVTTRPDDNARQDPVHGILRGAVRYFLSGGAKLFTGSTLPYLQMLTLLPAGTQSQIQENKEQDIDALNFAVRYAIDNAAWPATP